MAFGKLQFQLFVGDESLPVTDAEIIIISKDTSEAAEGIYAVDGDGKSGEITLYTYDKWLSEVPENEIQPYKTYDAIILSNKFSNKYIRNIPIFQDIKSIQKVQMTPKIRGGEDFDIINIPPNALLTKAHGENDNVQQQEEFYKEDNENSKILDKVVIPEYITVHLGAPSAYAQNITVPFVDYIKNVASSEIYPTWPRESLKANIYAQISFTLNRIFTEWYRSRGYDFDITNSTAYDQYFVPGRNYFDTVVDVVDEIFNEYISRKNFLEPLFAQYCNGTTVTCDGLSQWGTVDYANAGDSAFTILTRYYGNNIELRNADIVQGAVSSYPGKVLKVGSEGDDVKIIQRQLNRISQNYPGIPKVEEDGIFDDSTKKAVKKFQEVFNLTPDGIVGKQTWYKISRIYVGVKNLAEIESEGEEIPVPDVPPTDLLKYGSRGEEVRLAQYLLSAISVFYNNVRPTEITGWFGDKTLNSVSSFQQAFGLNVDGIIGKATWRKLIDIYKSIEPYILTSSGKFIKYPGYLIKYGASGEDVTLIQTWLDGLSKVYSFIPEVSIDGIFGPKTLDAVIMFQTWAGLIADGVVGPLTWDRLYEEYRNIVLGI